MQVHDSHLSLDNTSKSNLSRSPTTDLSSIGSTNPTTSVQIKQSGLTLESTTDFLNKSADLVWGVAKFTIYTVAAVKVVMLAVQLYNDPLGSIAKLGKYLVSVGLSLFTKTKPVVDKTPIDPIAVGGGGGSAW